jgi:DNA-binding protein H-NS
MAKLQMEAMALQQELIDRIRKDTGRHDLTLDQLVGSPLQDFAPKSTAGRKGTRPAKYSDGVGNTWSGYGRQPKWLREAVEGGKSLEEFLIYGKEAAVVEAADRRKPTTTQGRRGGKAEQSLKANPGKNTTRNISQAMRTQASGRRKA